jgi:hypothetical protein
MKIKAAWVEYTVVPTKKEDQFALYAKTSQDQGISSFYGLYTEESIKTILSRKQFNEWKAEKRNIFVKHLTIQERKNILKLNNKKKNDK